MAVREQCGTDAGYIRHLRAGETTCADCRKAHNAYASGIAAARVKALSRMTHEFPQRWRELYAEELELRGLKARKGTTGDER